MRPIVFAPIVILMVVLQSGCNDQDESKKAPAQKEAIQEPVNGEPPINQVNFLPDVPGDQPKVLTNSIDMKLVLIPKGTFMMGSPPDEKGSEENERRHEVTISRDYHLGMHEVTQAQYKKIMGKNPSNFQGDAVAERHPGTNRVVKDVDSANHPVEQVSWEDAVEFCQRLSALPEEKKAGRVYRLPSEAEWEYACRAGSQTAYSFGSDEKSLVNFGWYGRNSKEMTHAVGLKKANAWGLYDMHGNVWEWCADRYGEYPKGSATDPRGPEAGSSRVRRGGSWLNGAVYCRSAFRNWSDPSNRLNFLGFRVALSSSGIPK
jgi:formylglycine-generating enzyme required for sulfatase activity